MKKTLLLFVVLFLVGSLFAGSQKSQQIISAVQKDDVYSFKHLVSDDPEDVLTISYYGSDVNIYKYVIDNGNSELLSLLLEAGVDHNATFQYYSTAYTPLEYAAENKNTWATSLLLPVSDISKYSEDNKLMYNAVSSNSIAMVKSLLNNGVDVNSKFLYGGTYFTALSYSIYNKKTDLIDELLTIPGIDPDCTGSTKPALYYAIEQDQEALVSKLVGMGANPGRTFSYYGTVYNCLSYAIYQKKSYAIISKMIIKGDTETLKAAECSKTPLFCAVENNDLSVVSDLVEAGADVNTVFYYYDKAYNALTYAIYKKCRETLISALLSSPTLDKNFKGCDVSPYYYALYNKNPEVLQALLDCGINQNKAFVNYSTKYTPLSYAVSQKLDSTLIDPILNASGTDLNGRGSDFPPIYYAIYNNDAKTLQKLIDAGCNVNKTFNKNGKVYTPLGYATSSYSSNKDIKAILIAANASTVPVEEVVPFRSVVDSQDIEKLKEIMETADDLNEIFEVDSIEYSLLSYACYKNVGVSFLREILSSDAVELENDDCPVSPMAYAVINGNADTVSELIKAGINPNLKFRYKETDYIPLEYAVKNNIGKLIDVLLEYEGIDLYEETLSTSAMCYVISKGNTGLLQKFLDAGFDINHLISPSHNVLTYAIANSLPSSFISKILSIEGIDVNCSDTSDTPLYWSLYKNNLSVLRLLIDAGADVNAPMSYYSSSTNALGYAILTEKRMSFINSLIQADGIDINAAGMGYPCLFAAIDAGDLEALQALIAAGADVNTTMQYYGSPISAIEYAVEKKGRLSILDTIIKAPTFNNKNTYAIGKAFASAIENDDAEIVELFLNSGFDPNTKVSYYSTLYSLYDYAIKQNAIEEILNLLLDLI